MKTVILLFTIIAIVVAVIIPAIDGEPSAYSDADAVFSLEDLQAWGLKGLEDFITMLDRHMKSLQDHHTAVFIPAIDGEVNPTTKAFSMNDIKAFVDEKLNALRDSAIANE